jgi:replication factor C subunit 1
MMGTIAPATFASGNLPFPKFPEWLGKNSTTKRIDRMIRDVREMCAHHLYSDKKSILFESVPLIFEMILKLLIQGDHTAISEAVSVLEDFNLTMDAFKEHIIGLLLDQKSIDAYNALPPAVKGNFTKIYNTVFKSSIKAKKVKKMSGGDGVSYQKNFDAGEDIADD